MFKRTMIAVAVATLLSASSVAATSTDAPVLARVSVGEAGWDPSTGDAAAITHVLKRRAERRGVSVSRMARWYSTGHFDASRHRRRWVAGLTASATRPPGWPSGLPWRDGYRQRWLAMVDHVEAVLRGDVPNPCPGADHWGAPYGIDMERARRAGWHRVQCTTQTLNVFWQVPR